MASLVAQTVKKLPAMQETQVQSLGQEDALEKGVATHSSILAWRIPWTDEPRQAVVHGVAEWDMTKLLTLHFYFYINNTKCSQKGQSWPCDSVIRWTLSSYVIHHAIVWRRSAPAASTAFSAPTGLGDPSPCTEGSRAASQEKERKTHHQCVCLTPVTHWSHTRRLTPVSMSVCQAPFHRQACDTRKSELRCLPSTTQSVPRAARLRPGRHQLS